MSGAGRTARTSTASGGPRVSSQGDGIASLSLQPKLLKQINSHHTKEVRRALALGGESLHDWDSGNLQHMNRQQQHGTAPWATDLPSSGSMQTPGIVSTTVPSSSSNLFKLGCAWPRIHVPTCLACPYLLTARQELLAYIASCYTLLDDINLVTCIYRLARMFSNVKNLAARMMWSSELLEDAVFFKVLGEQNRRQHGELGGRTSSWKMVM